MNPGHLPLALLQCNRALSLVQVGKLRQHPWPHMLEQGVLCRQGCRAAGVEARLYMLQHAWKWKMTLGGIPALLVLAVNLHFWRVPASNGSGDFPRGSK